MTYDKCKIIENLKSTSPYLLKDERDFINKIILRLRNDLSKLNSYGDLKDVDKSDISKNTVFLVNTLYYYCRNTCLDLLNITLEQYDKLEYDECTEYMKFIIDIYCEHQFYANYGYSRKFNYNIPMNLIHLAIHKNRMYRSTGNNQLNALITQMIKDEIIQDFESKVNLKQLINEKIKEYEASKQ